jgi:hypothetical protein
MYLDLPRSTSMSLLGLEVTDVIEMHDLMDVTHIAYTKILETTSYTAPASLINATNTKWVNDGQRRTTNHRGETRPQTGLQLHMITDFTYAFQVAIMLREGQVGWFSIDELYYTRDCDAANLALALSRFLNSGQSFY